MISFQCTTFGAITGSYKKKANVIFRNDLSQPLNKLFCNQERQITTKDAWQNQVFDSQIDVQMVSSTESGPIDISKLRKAALKIAKAKYHNSIAAGMCDSKRGWVATMPAAGPILHKMKNSIELDTSTMNRYCSYWRVDFASASGSTPRRLFPKNSKKIKKWLNIDTRLLGNGVISTTCRPRKPKWIGTTMWFMLPINRGPGKIPFHSMLISAPDEPEALLSWINAVRQKHDLSPLDSKHAGLNWAGQQLAASRSIRHNRNHIKKVSQLLKEQRGQFIGENRVIGANNLEKAWLLWVSPRHRSLLLSKKPSHIAVGYELINQKKLSVVIFAKFFTNNY